MADQADLPLNDAAQTGAPPADNKPAADAAPASDAKPAADAPKADAPKADAKDGKDAKPAADGKDAKADAPADYTALKLPEGYKADDPVFADAIKLFEGEKISPDQAQKLIDFTVERDKAVAQAIQTQQREAWTKQTDEWKAASIKDTSPEQRVDAATALGKFFDKEAVATLESLGLTNHPGLIKGLSAIGKAIKDDTFVPGNAGRSNGSDARSLYPNSNMN